MSAVLNQERGRISQHKDDIIRKQIAFVLCRHHNVVLNCNFLCQRLSANIKLKIRGDRGHPCLMPLEMTKGEDNMEEQYTRAEEQEYNAIIAKKIWS